jgi:hypothetical protein
MDTVGDKLKPIEAAEEQRQAAKKIADEAAAADAEHQRYEACRDRIEEWKQDIAAAVGRGVLPPPLRVVPSPPRDGHTRWWMSSPESQDHPLYLELERWATEQGLEIQNNWANPIYSVGLLTVRTKR